MFQEERLRLIVEYLQKNKRINVEDICLMFSVSRDTARRDIVLLEKQGKIIRTHGGALIHNTNKEIKTYLERLQSEREEKKKIAKCAAALIKSGEHVIFDASTTVQACAEQLHDKDCTVITNSIDVADILTNKTGLDIILLGGRLNHEHRYVCGSATINMLSEYFVDKVFIGAVGLSKNGVSVAHDEDAAVVKKMIANAREVILLADQGKFGQTSWYRVCSLSNIDLVVTDAPPSKEMSEALSENGVSLIIAG